MNRQLLGLGFVALVAVTTGVWLQYEAAQPRSQDDLLFGDLAEKAVNINHITIGNHDGDVFTAVLEAGQWQAVLKEPSGRYPAEPGKLSELVKALIKARLSEAKTSKEENYHHLGLQALDNEDSLASLVILSSADTSWQVLVGKLANSGKGQYVRLPEQPQSWLINQKLSLPLEQHSWLKQAILPFDEVSFTTISRIDNEKWTIEKSASQSEFTLKKIPSGRELKYQSILDSVASNLADLNFDKLQEFEENFWASLEPMASLRVTTQTAESFDINLAALDDKTYVKFTSDELEGYWLNWVYEVSRLSAQQLTKTVEDFLLTTPEEIKGASNEIKATDEGESPR